MLQEQIKFLRTQACMMPFLNENHHRFNQFTIRGPLNANISITESGIALYRLRRNLPLTVVPFNLIGEDPIQPIYKVDDLTVSASLKRTQSNPYHQYFSEIYLVFHGLPSYLLLFNRDTISNEEVVEMFTPTGTSPTFALKELKSSVSRFKKQFN